MLNHQLWLGIYAFAYTSELALQGYGFFQSQLILLVHLDLHILLLSFSSPSQIPSRDGKCFPLARAGENKALEPKKTGAG